MNLVHALFWGFAGTIVMTVITGASRGLGFTRMDISFMVGTMFTSDRDRATWIGFAVHLLNGWLFALVYAFAFELSGLRHWWFGLGIGLVHGLFLLLFGMRVLPSIHPRMASELRGPDPTRQLEPPGFMALNYGRGTPISTLVSHAAYGAILGLFY